MKGFLKRYGGVLFIALTIAVVVFIALKDGGWPDTVAALRSMDWRWEALAGLLWLLFVGSRAYTMKFYLARQGVFVRFGAAFHASLIGLFYSGVTPAASGGQPMQMYHLRKEGVPVSVSASGVIVKFVGFQSMLLLLCAVFLGFHWTFVRETVGSSFFLIVLGFAINAVVVAAVLLLLISRRAVRVIVRFALSVGQKVRLVKDRPAMERRIGKAVGGYFDSLSTVRDRPLDLIAMFGLSGLQVISYASIIWALYHAFGLSSASALQLIAIQLLLYQTVSFVPLPGASGAQEGLFFLFLHTIVPDSMQIGMLFAWRFFTFYLTMLAGGLTVVWDGVRGLRRRG